MSRPLRIEYPDAWYHVMNRGRRGEEIFGDRHDYERFSQILKETAELWKLRVAAYCFLPNHYHLLVQTPEGNLSRCLRHIDGVYTQRYNRYHGCDGPFRGRYKSILVEADSYLLPLLRYIHRNPVRAGLSKTLDGYPWSSHRGYVSGAEKWNWLHKAFILSMFSLKKGDRLKAYQRFVSLEDEEKIWGVMERKKWPSLLGSDAFINWIREKFYSGKMDDEVPQSRELAPEVDQIKLAVSRFYGIGREELLFSRRGVFNEPRNIAIYLTRYLRGDTLRRIGEDFQIRKYSSVSSVIERIKRMRAEDRKVSVRLEKLISQLRKSQEQT